MAEILSTIVRLLGALPSIKQYVIDPLKVQFSYLCCSDRILKNLEDEIARLENTRGTLQPRVDAARRELKIIRPNVEEWLKKVDEIKIQTDRILGDRPEVQQGCVNGSCPNLKLRYSVSKKAEKMAKVVAVEVQSGLTFSAVADPPPPPGMEIIPVPSGTEFESRKTKEEEIMAALWDDSVYLIGICGMGGVGKTTMANRIWKRAKEEEKPFDVVAMAVVSQQLDEKRIQKKIAEYLRLELKEDDVLISADHLRRRIGQEKSVLIIIDDIWEALDPVKLGIPSPGEHKRCKIILTSRDHGVCLGTEAKLRETEATEMKATKIFSLEGLTENEAWALFKAKAGSVIDRCGLHDIAEKVAKECKSLPLALVTVGCAMAETNAQENPRPAWEDALLQLQSSAPSNIPKVIEEVYRPLELSYNHLCEEAKHLFRLCCLFPEDSQISLKCLLHYGVGLRIFDLKTLRQARNRVDSLVETLKSRNLLIDDGTRHGIRRVKMHDVIRDMAIFITHPDFMISHDTSEWPEKDSYKNCTYISLKLEDSVTLPQCIDCPTLKMLRVRSNSICYWEDWDDDDGWQVPDTFFDGMRELNVLDIECNESLPSSLQALTNLRTLRLHHSKMETASMIGQLVNLEILDLRHSRFTVLPKEIGRLQKLKSLDLRWCNNLREIAPGVISRLERLEELFVLESFTNWEAEVEGEERKNASLEEVASLKYLTALQLKIQDPKVLPLHWPELKRFVIFIRFSEEIDDPDYVRKQDYGDKNLILDLTETTPSVHALIKKADRLELNLTETGGSHELIRGASDGSAELVTGNSAELAMGKSDELVKSIQERNEHLKSLNLDGCHHMRYLANKLSEENNVFPKLGHLSLSDCRNLEGISSVMPSLAGSFCALEVLNLCDLDKLTHFFWHRKRCLPNLREVDINYCSSLQYVFLQSTAESSLQEEEGGSTDVVGPIEFPNLTKLSLSKLPSFNSFWKADNGIESLHISYGRYLFNQKVTFTSIKELTLDSIGRATEIFSSQIPIASFSQLERLEVQSCLIFKVISSPACSNFRNLKMLKIRDCLNLVAVVGKEDEKAQPESKEPLFPELKILTLKGLPNFKKFCLMKNDIELPKLESITIEDCPQMETFSPRSLSSPGMQNVFGWSDPNLAPQIFFHREVFASLVELKLSNIIATKIFSRQIPAASFSQLKLLEVESCRNLKAIFSPPTFRNFTTLGKLTVKNCSKLKEVVGKEDEESQAVVKEPLFPELKELILSEVPSFKTFCYMMKNDIELPQLESITIKDCCEMETFSVGSVSLPRLTYLFGLLKPDLATRIFFKKETPKREIHFGTNNFTLSVEDLSGFDTYNSELCLVKDSSDNFMFARRFGRGVLRLNGRFEMVKLLPDTLYEVLFEIRLGGSGFQRGDWIELKLTQSKGITQRHDNLTHLPTGEWIELLAGEFTTGPTPIGDLEFSFSSSYTWGKVFFVKCVTIRPKV